MSSSDMTKKQWLISYLLVSVFFGVIGGLIVLAIYYPFLWAVYLLFFMGLNYRMHGTVLGYSHSKEYKENQRLWTERKKSLEVDQ